MCRCGGGGWGSRIRSASPPRCPPASASRRLADARVLVTEMPATLHALAAGRVSERGVRAAITETRCLTREDRGRVDAELGPVVETMSVPGDHPGGAAAGDRTRPGRRGTSGSTCPGGPVRVHPTPARHDGQDHRSPAGRTGRGLLRLTTAAAETAKATGDERTKDQIKADTLVERITGQATAAAIPVEVQLVMTSDALLGRSEEPAQLPGHGPLPAFLARRIITRDPATPAQCPGVGPTPAARSTDRSTTPSPPSTRSDAGSTARWRC